MPKAPLLVAYDGECSLCRKKADWLQRRDAHGLLVLFPVQHPELARLAPELAGRPLLGELHGLDLATRRVLKGAELLPELLGRLPGWRLLAPALRIPALARFAAWLTLKRDERRFRRSQR
ncbi:MAG TPA: DCC1-like thiol-disulfide oxidoreductase family protein [Holophagaceae bacterium]|nr:DCC1-like thiol-disulfide oxidoreductase family protein [Holophagaceae bacterium]